MTLSHIQLNSPKLEEQVCFYEKYFSFKRKAHGNGWFLWNQSGFLIAINPLEEAPVMPSWFHIGFRYETKDEVKSIYKNLRQDGKWEILMITKITLNFDFQIPLDMSLKFFGNRRQISGNKSLVFHSNVFSNQTDFVNREIQWTRCLVAGDEACVNKVRV